MGLISLLGILFVYAIAPAILCFRRGRLDAGKMQCQSIRPPLILAAILTGVTAFFMLAVFVLLGEPHVPTGMPSAQTALVFVLLHVFVFALTLVSGMLAYSAGHIGNSTNEGSFRSDGPPIRLEETGNPYQPPAT